MMLYEWYEAQRALLSPFSEFAAASARLYNHPLSPFSHTAARQPDRSLAEADAPARQGLREARVQHPLGAGRRCRDRRSRTGRDRQALLPPASLQAFHRRPADPAAHQGAAHRADRRAALGPPRHVAARDGARNAARPQGLHHRLDRRAHGARRSRPLPPRRLRALRAGIHSLHRPGGQRRLGVPADGAGSGSGVADGQRGRGDAAHDDDDGRPDRCPHEPHPR